MVRPVYRAAVKKLLYLLPCIPAVFGVFCFLDAAPPEPAGRDAVVGPGLTFVYLHGFGGIKEDPEFCENMREFLAEAGNASRVVNYEWESVRVDPLQAGASWLESQRRADMEAGRFKEEIIDPLEAERSPYVLVGFSVGSRVVLRALEQVDGELESLRGVYFLGPAMTKDTTLADRGVLPGDMKITNYHSPLHDVVHKVAFDFMSEVPAGGQVGFDDEAVFENLPVSCSHVHKGVGVHIDYSGLAGAIAAIELYRSGVRIPGDTKFNLETGVGDGEVWWNKVARVGARLDGEAAEVEIEQHNMRAGYYRALRVDPDGGRTRVARGGNLHAILDEIGATFDR